MRRLAMAMAVLSLAVGCGPDSGAADELELQLEELSGADADGDGIPDALEDALAKKFAPEFRFGPSGEEKNLPSSVDWFLARAALRFNHGPCGDHVVRAQGTLTQSNLSTVSHRTTNWLCAHTQTVKKSNEKKLEYNLHATSTATRAGSPPSEWKLYTHVRKSTLQGGAWDIQYWIFFPYQSGPLGFDHEGDWEHITITVDARREFFSAWYAAHSGGTRFRKADLTFVEGTHPVVYTAIGTHASYARPGSYESPSPFKDVAKDGGPRWRTWESPLVNLGEIGKPLNGQHFILYGGRWGSVGKFDFTSGPPTPTFQGSWNTR